MPNVDPSDAIVLATRTERRRLVDLLADLGPDGWSHPSMCAGWRVREVVAHISMAYRIGTFAFLAGIVRSGFSYHRYADRSARADAVRISDAELLDCLRANVDHPWQPPSGGAAAALGHDIIHGLDITEPLGLPPAPPEAIATVLRTTRSKDISYFGVDITGHRLIATDADAAVGDGTEVAMSAREILMTITGRRELEANETAQPNGLTRRGATEG